MTWWTAIGSRVCTPSLADALIPLITLALLIAGALALFGLDALDGPISTPLYLPYAVFCYASPR